MIEILVCLLVIGVMLCLILTLASLFYKNLYLPCRPSKILNIDKSEANRRDW